MSSSISQEDDSSPTPSPASEEQYSPTDGYFDDRHHPRDLYVGTRTNFDPSKGDQASVESLLRSCLSSSTPIPGTRRTPSTLSEWSGETSPLLGGGSPPPAYSTSGSLFPITRSSNYRQDGFQPFQSTHHPGPQVLQDMNVDSQVDRRQYGESLRWKRRRSSICNPRRLIVTAASIASCTIFVWLLIAMTGDRRSEDRLLPVPGHFTPEWPDSCAGASLHSKQYEFKHLENFKFTDMASGNSDLWARFGTVRVLPGPIDQDVDLKINMTSTANYYDIVQRLSDVDSDYSVALQAPSLKVLSSRRRALPCRAADIALFFRPGLVLQNLDITSLHLDVFISSDLVVQNTTKISLESGALTVNPFISSRKTYIEMGSSSISGEYSLYDVLSIQSKSGSMNVDVKPKKADPDSPQPAVLEMRSKSGSINVQFPPHGGEVPEREYHTTVVSSSGTINGRFLHGKHSVLETSSSTITADILPYSADDYASTLHTRSASGSQKINVLSPYFDPRTTIARLSSTHFTSSGTLSLIYPDEWEGELSGRTSSGSLSLRGRDVRIIDQGSSGGGKYIVAEKGDGESKLRFNTKSGSVNAVVGF